MSFGILNPQAGYQAQGVLSPGYQPSTAPVRSQGADLSQYSAQTNVPQAAPVQYQSAVSPQLVANAASVGLPPHLLNKTVDFRAINAAAGYNIGGPEGTQTFPLQDYIDQDTANRLRQQYYSYGGGGNVTYGDLAQAAGLFSPQAAPVTPIQQQIDQGQFSNITNLDLARQLQAL